LSLTRQSVSLGKYMLRPAASSIFGRMTALVLAGSRYNAITL
jgi:hypothetical protein